jgi:hypothetical protein
LSFPHLSDSIYALFEHTSEIMIWRMQIILPNLRHFCFFAEPPYKPSHCVFNLGALSAARLVGAAICCYLLESIWALDGQPKTKWKFIPSPALKYGVWPSLRYTPDRHFLYYQLLYTSSCGLILVPNNNIARGAMPVYGAWDPLLATSEVFVQTFRLCY